MKTATFVKITCTLKHVTAKAILVVVDDQEMWLPRSVIELHNLADGTALVSIPEWLAIKHDLT